MKKKAENNIINRKLIFVQSTFGDAHQMMRYLELKKKYRESELLAFKRPYYKTVKDLEHTIIGDIQHGNYYKRIFVYIKSLFLLKLRLSKIIETDIYFYGFDYLPFVSVFFNSKKRKLIFEIPDLRETFFKNNFSAKIHKRLFKYFISKISIVVVTSELFVSDFFKKNKITIKKYVLIENKVHLINRPISSKKNNDTQQIIIGYFGLVRCEKSLIVLIDFLDINKKFNLIIYGYYLGISDELIDRVKNSPNIYYKGTYKSPMELYKIYNEIDISWIVYPYSKEKDGNFKYARTNRFYEAGFFNKPMIANKFSGDAKFVKSYNVGVNIDLKNINKSVKELNIINKRKLTEWKTNLEMINLDVFQSCDKDYKKLIEELNH